MQRKIGHLDEEESNAIQILAKRLQQEYGAEKFILFGSKSRGDYSKYSDVDLLVLTKNKLTSKKIDEFFDVCSEVNVDFGVAINCVVIAQEDWVNEEDINLSLKYNIEKDGVSIAV